jgi:hypothetical protein
MKLELSRAEIVQIILDHINDIAPYAKLDCIQNVFELPDTITVHTKEETKDGSQ